MNSFKSKILFRCDAGYIPEIGSGHLYRCLTIAKFLKKKVSKSFSKDPNLKSLELAIIEKTGLNVLIKKRLNLINTIYCNLQ